MASKEAKSRLGGSENGRVGVTMVKEGKRSVAAG